MSVITIIIKQSRYIPIILLSDEQVNYILFEFDDI